MWHFIPKTTLDNLITLNVGFGEPEGDEFISEMVTSSVLRTYWQNVMNTDGSLKLWSELPPVPFAGGFSAPNYDTANESGITEWIITARRGHVPGLLQLGYFLATNSDPDTPDSIVSHTLDDSNDLQTPALRIDSYDSGSESPPLAYVKYRWLPSKLAELA